MFWKNGIKVVKMKKEFEMIKRRKTYLSMRFIDLEGRVSFAYVPVRDQNLVVRGWNWRLICFLCFLVLKMVLKWKAKWQMRIGLCFLILKKIAWSWIKLINVWFKKINWKSNGSLDLESRFIKKMFFWFFWLCECFCYF